jgi:hypothetical protein
MEKYFKKELIIYFKSRSGLRSGGPLLKGDVGRGDGRIKRCRKARAFLLETGGESVGR